MLYLKLNNINVLRLNELMNDRLKRLEGGDCSLFSAQPNVITLSRIVGIFSNNVHVKSCSLCQESFTNVQLSIDYLSILT